MIDTNIKIFFCCNHKYIKPTNIAIASLADNTNAKCDIYIIGDISHVDQEKTHSLEKKFPHIKIYFYYFDIESVFQDVKLNRQVTVDGFARMLIPVKFPEIDRAIYLDGDIIVVGDIADLWNQDIGHHAMGAVERLGLEEPTLNKYKKAIDIHPQHKYFNSGVLLIDCKKWRNYDILTGLLKVERDTAGKRVLNDQCVLNKFFENDYANLNSRYNEVDTLFESWPFDHSPDNVVIKHFTGMKPWLVNKKSGRLNDVFWKYAFYTEFFNDIILDLNKDALEKLEKVSPVTIYKGKYTMKNISLYFLSLFAPLSSWRKKFRKKLEKNNKSTAVKTNKPKENQAVKTVVNYQYITEDEYDSFMVSKFYEKTQKLPNEELETLNQKIIWYMMFDENPLRTQCSDKYAVREYVEKRIGSKYLPKLLGVWDNVSDINFTDLPKSFFLKLNNGCARNLFIEDKHTAKFDEIQKKMRVWMLTQYYKYQFEMQYKGIQNKIIAEEYLDMAGGMELKCWCFHGKVEFIKVEILYETSLNGHTENMGGKYFSPEWLPMPFTSIGKELSEIPKPDNLEELITNAETLAVGFDFVRIDFYRQRDGTFTFGECTFSPAAGRIKFNPPHTDFELGRLLTLPPRGLNGRITI